VTTPRRIQRRRTKGWRLPPGAVYVGRPTIWGNPFPVGARVAETNHQVWLTDQQLGSWRSVSSGSASTVHIVTDRAEAVRLYEKWLRYEDDYFPRKLATLRGHDLACWCPPGPCHADVLIRLANPTS
jgi:hypothetical protein